ncbi:MAG: A/G-specific adenine glycosylase [Desulfobacteraceae bacterium]|nr:MAG: A/G-specific adenine glycosylase [Desulfobacteraceae bacterium]
MSKPDLSDIRLPVIAADLRSTIRHLLSEWYAQCRRDLPWRRTRDPYAIWISEVMLQQTQVNTATPYFRRFLELFPDVQRLARADEQSVLKAWEGLGYYSRARNLWRAARILDTRGGQVPAEWQTLRQLPGIGDYIAAAVLSIAFGLPYAVVDGNVKRVLARLLCLDTPVNQAKGHRLFQAAADRFLDRRHPGRHNQAVMELGALICGPHKPLCAQCPLGMCCEALQSRSVDQYPRRAERPKVGQQHWAAGVIVKNGRLLLTQRPATGLLAGMWEFPSVRPGPAEDPGQACLAYIRSALGLSVGLRQRIAGVRHAYTHFKLRLDVYLYAWQSGRIRLDGPADFQWVRPDRIERLPLHGAVHKVLPALITWLG